MNDEAIIISEQSISEITPLTSLIIESKVSKYKCLSFLILCLNFVVPSLIESIIVKIYYDTIPAYIIILVCSTLITMLAFIAGIRLTREKKVNIAWKDFSNINTLSNGIYLLIVTVCWYITNHVWALFNSAGGDIPSNIWYWKMSIFSLSLAPLISCFIGLGIGYILIRKSNYN